MNKINSFEQLLESIQETPRKQSTLLIGIDGCGGSGKSTVAAKIKEKLPNVTVVHMDDFYLPSGQLLDIPSKEKPVGADVDWKRVLSQVIEPISQNKEGHYQRYDWVSDSLAEWHIVPVGEVVVIEGVYATRKELRDFYDLTIWVNTPRETRLSRGLERDGEEARDRWENDWMVSEDVYVAQHRPQEHVDVVIDGTR